MKEAPDPERDHKQQTEEAFRLWCDRNSVWLWGTEGGADTDKLREAFFAGVAAEQKRIRELF